MASVYLSTRSLMDTDNSIAIIFYYSFALLITSLIFFPRDFIIPNLNQLIPLMSLGFMGSLGHYFMSQAAKNAEVVVISPFEYTSFIFVGLMGYFFFQQQFYRLDKIC
jgi:drug/metabolite transporter (DMT)-like permease